MQRRPRPRMMPVARGRTRPRVSSAAWRRARPRAIMPLGRRIRAPGRRGWRVPAPRRGRGPTTRRWRRRVPAMRRCVRGFRVRAGALQALGLVRRAVLFVLLLVLLLLMFLLLVLLIVLLLVLLVLLVLVSSGSHAVASGGQRHSSIAVGPGGTDHGLSLGHGRGGGRRFVHRHGAVEHFAPGRGLGELRLHTGGAHAAEAHALDAVRLGVLCAAALDGLCQLLLAQLVFQLRLRLGLQSAGRNNRQLNGTHRCECVFAPCG